MHYKKILLKLSGEALAGHQSFGIAPDLLTHYTKEISKAYRSGITIAIVIGGGNIWRGEKSKTLGIERVPADYMGMLATMINSLALHNALTQQGIPTRLMSQVPMQSICEAYSRAKALQYLQKNYIVIIGAGLGKPYFTTDTAASLSAIELGVDVLVKGTNVDGIYSADPKKNKQATRYTELNIEQVLQKKLQIMDMTALTLCTEQHLPIIVYNATKKDRLMQVLTKKELGTFIHP